jgi:lipopolysaccharide/colanic/teichoic acid biosynthesis glycosyltransferase
MSVSSRSTVAKRTIDLAIALPLLVVLSPLIVGLGILLRVRQGSPVLFRQERPGLGGRPFTMYKFRSMANEWLDADGEEIAPEDRTTRIGKWLRATSLDELPELWNVVRGDMSLVGPRPLLMEYLDRYTPDQARRHEVRPGVTGLSQVSGRNAMTWDDRFVLDLRYVDQHDLRMDMEILVKTLRVVLMRDGVLSAEGKEMPEFLGNEPADAKAGTDR